MHIEIEPAERVIPLIIFKRDRRSNVIKKSELRIYHETQALLMAMQERVGEYQTILEQQVVQMIEDKELSLNAHVEETYNTVSDNLMKQQARWFEQAETQLELLLQEEEQNLNALKDELKGFIVSAVQSRLTKLNQSEHLIHYLVEVLHSEMDDYTKALMVEKSYEEDDGVTLTIENEDRVVSINTGSLIAELRASLDLI